jgi:hypothetical protein
VEEFVYGRVGALGVMEGRVWLPKIGS